MFRVFLGLSLPYLFETRSLTNPGTHQSTRATCLRSPRDLVVSASPGLILQAHAMPDFLCGQ